MTAPSNTFTAGRNTRAGACGRGAYQARTGAGRTVQGMDQPWNERTDSTATRLPALVTGEWLAGLDGSDLSVRVLRAQLPRPASDRQMPAWRRYWLLLAFDERRRSRAVSQLAAWCALADEAVAQQVSDQAELRSIRSFRSLVKDAITRLEKLASDEPLSWAGTRYAPWPRPARQDAEDLAVAIYLHELGELTDEQLYRVRSATGLDPAGGIALPAAVVERVRAIADQRG